MTNVLKQDNFNWDQTAAEAFLILKESVTQALVLALRDFSRPFILETDALGTGTGAVLSQNHHPIAFFFFFFQKITPRLQRQSTYGRIFCANVESIAKFRHYLLDYNFIIKTDLKSLNNLTDHTILTPKRQAWLHKILGYDFTIEYKSGKENVAADSLS